MNARRTAVAFGHRLSQPDTGRWLVIGLLGIILWLAARGRLVAVVQAMEQGNGGGGDGSGTGGTGTGGLTPSASYDPAQWQTPSGYPSAAEFLTVAPTSYASGFSVPGVAQIDSQGIQAEGGSYAYADWDYGVPYGSSVHLPGTSDTKYTILPTKWGDPHRTVVAQIQNGPGAGGIVEFLHLSMDNAQPGSTMHGGQIIGQSGYPQGPDEYGAGNHLAVVPDPVAGKWLQTLN